MKKAWKVVLIVGLSPIAAVLGVILAIAIGSGPILEYGPPEPLQFAAEYFFPPKDLWDPVGIASLDIGTPGAAARLVFRNRYVGKSYVAGVMWNLRVPSMDITKTTLRLAVRFYVGDRLVLTRVLSDFGPFSGKDHEGFEDLVFGCPQDLPVRKDITCEVQVEQPDSGLAARLGPAHFFIARSTSY